MHGFASRILTIKVTYYYNPFVLNYMSIFFKMINVSIVNSNY